MEKIGNMIRDGIKPDLTAYTSIERMEDDGKTLIRVSVSRGLKRPYHLTDKELKPVGVFIRHGVSSVPATDEAIRQMLRESDGTTFDKMRSVNQELIFEYAEKTFQTSQIAFDAAHKRTLGLIDVDGYYTNAALLLSDQCRHIIRCAIYEGTGKNHFKTHKEFSGARVLHRDPTKPEHSGDYSQRPRPEPGGKHPAADGKARRRDPQGYGTAPGLLLLPRQ